MLQSGLTRLKSVFSEAKDSAKDSTKDARPRPPGGHTGHAPALRSASVSAPGGLRPDQARQLLSKVRLVASVSVSVSIGLSFSVNLSAQVCPLSGFGPRMFPPSCL